jgi:hypothetical protein
MREISGSYGGEYEDECLLECCVLMMEAASTSETSVNFYQTTQRNIPEDSHFKKQRVSITKTSLLIVFREILAVYFENHAKAINTLGWQNAELLNVKTGGTHSRK